MLRTTNNRRLGEKLACGRDEQRFILAVIATVCCNALAGLTFRSGRTFANTASMRRRAPAT
jgi:hypothetical protein